MQRYTSVIIKDGDTGLVQFFKGAASTTVLEAGNPRQKGWQACVSSSLSPQPGSRCVPTLSSLGEETPVTVHWGPPECPQLPYFHKDAVSKAGHVLRYWGSGLY